MDIAKLREWWAGITLPPGMVNSHVNLWPLRKGDCKIDLVVRYRDKDTTRQTAKQIVKSLVTLFEDAGYTVRALKVERASKVAVYGYTCSATFEVLGFVMCEELGR